MTPVQGRRYYDTGSPLPPFKLNLHGYHLLLPRLVHRGDRLLYSGHILLHCRYRGVCDRMHHGGYLGKHRSRMHLHPWTTFFLASLRIYLSRGVRVRGGKPSERGAEKGKRVEKCAGHRRGQGRGRPSGRCVEKCINHRRGKPSGNGIGRSHQRERPSGKCIGRQRGTRIRKRVEKCVGYRLNDAIGARTRRP